MMEAAFIEWFKIISGKYEKCVVCGSWEVTQICYDKPWKSPCGEIIHNSFHHRCKNHECSGESVKHPLSTIESTRPI